VSGIIKPLHWEEFQHGVQGTQTGSLHNQLGLESTKNRSPTHPYSQKKSNKTKKLKSKKIIPQSSSCETNDYTANKVGFLVALIAFAVTAYWIYDSTQDNHIAALIAGIIAASIAGKYYKVILILSCVVGAFYIKDKLGV